MSSTSETQSARNGVTDRQGAEAAIARMLLDRIRSDTYPSTTQMDMLEAMMPPALVSEYFEVLLDKVADDRWPSISLLRRLTKLTASM